MNMEKYQEKSPKYGLTFCFLAQSALANKNIFPHSVCKLQCVIERLLEQQ